MANGVVDPKTTAGSLAQILQDKLGRRVVVHRTDQTFKKPGAYKVTTVARYSIYIEGSHPELFPNLTINDLKARMAMLMDLIWSGVLMPVGTDGLPRPVRGARPDVPDDGADALPVASGRTGGADDDRY